jgi:CheY-like chemotaxis protein
LHSASREDQHWPRRPEPRRARTVARERKQFGELMEARRDITVVFTDIQMPGSMDGLKLARAVRGRWPPIKIVATSGQLDLRETDLPEGGRFLAKPYGPLDIAGVLRELIDGG